MSLGIDWVFCCKSCKPSCQLHMLALKPRLSLYGQSPILCKNHTQHNTYCFSCGSRHWLITHITMYFCFFFSKVLFFCDSGPWVMLHVHCLSSIFWTQYCFSYGNRPCLMTNLNSIFSISWVGCCLPYGSRSWSVTHVIQLWNYVFLA